MELACLSLRAAAGDDTGAFDASGTWKLTKISTNAAAHPSAQTLKLKLEGGTLTGRLSYNAGAIVKGKAPTSELPITDAKLKGNEISFNFSHPPTAGNGPNATYHYQGTITGDTIGSSYDGADGETRTRAWQAERVRK